MSFQPLRACEAFVLAGLLLLGSATAAAQGPDPACLEEQNRCGIACGTIGVLETEIRCICQCAFAACECGLAGTGFEDLCVEQVSAICANDFTGLTQDDPILPIVIAAGRFEFPEVVGGMWCDPPFTDGFDYQMTGASRFTAILDFPTGFGQPFTVSVGEQVLGSFGPGESVSFAGFPGGGVEAFRLSGIAPEVDAAQPDAFPLRLLYDTPTASFSMTAIPEPGGALNGLVAGAVLVSLLALRSRTERSTADR